MAMSVAHATEWVSHDGIAQLFGEAAVNGTFVLYDTASDRYVGHDAGRAATRFVPASTFKIPNALIGLARGSVRDVDEALPYGGAPQPFPQWAWDMGLREAIAMSNVPVFQALARRTGLGPMREEVERLDYGNGEIGDRVDRFWLDGPLAISAIGQVRFLDRLARGALPLPTEVQAAVRGIVLLEQGEGWALYGKTGWQNAPDAGVGWWVGWVEREDRIYPFALNLDVRNPDDAAKRVPLGKQSLRALGAMP